MMAHLLHVYHPSKQPNGSYDYCIDTHLRRINVVFRDALGPLDRLLADISQTVHSTNTFTIHTRG